MISPAKSGLLNLKLPDNKKKTIPFLINTIKDRQRDPNAPKYCFLLGAGTSVSAGIPSGGGLTDYVRKRCFLREEHTGHTVEDTRYERIDNYFNRNNIKAAYNEFVTAKEETFKQLVDAEQDRFINSLPVGLWQQLIPISSSVWDDVKEAFYQDNFYGMWFNEFSASPRDRQELIEELIDGKEPSAGYILLSLLVEKDIVRHFFTTNFDDLIHDAIFSEAGKKSRVFSHNETTHFINFKSRRPNIIKLHGDYLYQDIRNTVEETSKLAENQKDKLYEAASEMGMIVIGYSGSDQSIMDALEAIKQARGSDFAVIWCGRSEASLNWRAKLFISQHPNTWYVEIEGFDQLMVKLFNECKCELKTVEQRIEKVESSFNKVTAVLKAGNLKQKSPDEKLDRTLSITQAMNEAYSEKDLQKRLIKQNEIVKKYPDDAIVYLDRGNTFSNLNDFANSLADYSQAIVLRPHYTDAYINRAILKDKMGDTTGAISDCDQAITLRPDDAEIYFGRATIKDKVGDILGALIDYDQAITLRPEYAEGYSNRGLVKEKLGDATGSLADYDIAVTLQPSSAVFYYNRALTKSRLGNHNEALVDLDKAIALQPDDADAYAWRGSVKVQTKDYVGAIDDFDKVVKLQPDDAVCYHNRGIAKSQAEDYAGAVTDFDQAIVLQPDNIDLHYDRGVAKSKLEEYSNAIIDFDKVISLNSEHSEAYSIRGLAKGHIGDYVGAITDHDKAIFLRADNSGLYNNRGIAKGQAGDYIGATTDFDQAVTLQPNNAGAYINRATARGHVGDYVNAISDFDKAISLEPKNAQAYVQRGIIKCYIKEYISAVADFNWSIFIQPDDFNTYFNRGIAKGQLGDCTGAMIDFDKTIDLKPDLAEAYANRGSIKNDIEEYISAVIDYDQAISLRSNDANLYNNRGNTKRKIGDFYGALSDAKIALQLKPKDGVIYSTLAEIYAQMGIESLFYENIEQALKNGCPVWEFLDDQAYSYYRDDPRFIELLNQYHKCN